MHRATLPDPTTFVAAPNSPPFGPPDDDLVEADQPGALLHIRMPLPPCATERRRVQKMPTVSSFSRQPQRVVRARRREKRPFRIGDPVPRRCRGGAPRLSPSSLLDQTVNPVMHFLRF
eukprot:6260116-Prymnesium_polylepis.1